MVRLGKKSQKRSICGHMKGMEDTSSGEKKREREKRSSEGGGDREREPRPLGLSYHKCLSPVSPYFMIVACQWGSRKIENEVLRRRGARAEVCSAAGRSPRTEVAFPEAVLGLPGAAGITVKQD